MLWGFDFTVINFLLWVKLNFRVRSVLSVCQLLTPEYEQNSEWKRTHLGFTLCSYLLSDHVQIQEKCISFWGVGGYKGGPWQNEEILYWRQTFAHDLSWVNKRAGINTFAQPGNIFCRISLKEVRNIFCVSETNFVSTTNVAYGDKEGNIFLSMPKWSSWSFLYSIQCLKTSYCTELTTLQCSKNIILFY